jgi:hypothetical protein
MSSLLEIIDYGLVLAVNMSRQTQAVEILCLKRKLSEQAEELAVV